ncbi:hypothetical protein ACFL6C_03070 [Myxococcota bacterium]
MGGEDPTDQPHNADRDAAGDGVAHGDSSGGDPLQDDSTGGDPLQGDPSGGDPLQGDPSSGDQLQGDAYTPECGNGTLDPNEVCDDGNTDDGDACNSTCEYGAVQVAKVLASDGEDYDDFGGSMSVSGDVLAVGAPGKDDGADFTGAGYVFGRNHGGEGNWGEVTKLYWANKMSDGFGSVSVSGNTLFGGAGDATGNATDSGVALVFDGSMGWSEIRRLSASDAASHDAFGRTVRISGDIAVVGASGRDSGMDGNAGAAYVFYRSSGTWPEARRILPPEPQQAGYFGTSVSVSGDTTVVGNLGQRAAWVFQQNEGGPDSWGQVKKVTPLGGDADDRFGASVALHGDTLAVGAGGDQNGTGAVYVFYRDRFVADDWGQLKKLTAPDVAAGDVFGGSVAIEGEFIIVGASRHDQPSEDSGAAYIFARHLHGTDNWGLWAKIVSMDAAEWDFFGSSVDISAHTVVVGATGVWSPPDWHETGAVFVFEIVD